MLWDRGTWEPKGDPHAGLEEGHLAFTLHGERLKGGWDLIRMRVDGKKENWLLIKEKDKYALNNGQAQRFLEGELSTVSTHRSMEEIAAGAPESMPDSGPGSSPGSKASSNRSRKAGSAIFALNRSSKGSRPS